jgi:peptidoglycan/xylan/chitin deacetylase (PgdA/CDA1 family)
MKKNIKVFGARILNRLGIIALCTPRQSVVILMYHRVNRTPDCLGLTVPPELFSLQLRYLKEHFRIVSLKDAVLMISEGSVNTRCCAVTFDDGYRDNYEIAAPLLAEHGVPATIFVTYDAIETGQFGWGAFDRTILNFPEAKLDLSDWGLGAYPLGSQTDREQAVIALHRLLKQQTDSLKRQVVDHVVSKYRDESSTERTMMNWDEVRHLAQDDLFTIGAHTITHPILSRVSHDHAVHEITDCKRLLEAKIGRSVDFFAYPNGGKEDINDDIISIVKQSKYDAACTTISGLNMPGGDAFTLKRIDVTTNMSTDYCEKFSPDMFEFYISCILNQNINE